MLARPLPLPAESDMGADERYEDARYEAVDDDEDGGE